MALYDVTGKNEQQVFSSFSFLKISDVSRYPNKAPEGSPYRLYLIFPVVPLISTVFVTSALKK